MPRKKTHVEYEQELKELAISLIPEESYINSSTPILHSCFLGHKNKIAPNNVLTRGRCPECSKKSKVKTSAEYIQELRTKGIDYDILEDYKTSDTSIIHRCTKGHQWKARPNGILSNGLRCPKCSINRMKTRNEYQEQLIATGTGFLLLEKYKGAHVPVLHQCSKGHTWTPTPTNVLRGQGCPGCAKYGFKPEQPAILYYVKVSCEKDIYYKVGITNKTIKERFAKDKDKEIVVLLEKHFDLGLDAYDEERLILQKHKAKKAKILSPFLNGKGDTELFEEDILGLDT